MTIDPSFLEKSLTTLKKYKTHADFFQGADNKDLAEVVRAGTIQAFEHTYELSIKHIQRCLCVLEPSTETRDLSFQSRMELAEHHGLVDESRHYIQYRTIRNLTVHTYDETHAIQVISVMDQFIDSTQKLIDNSKKRLSL